MRDGRHGVGRERRRWCGVLLHQNGGEENPRNNGSPSSPSVPGGPRASAPEKPPGAGEGCGWGRPGGRVLGRVHPAQGLRGRPLTFPSAAFFLLSSLTCAMKGMSLFA